MIIKVKVNPGKPTSRIKDKSSRMDTDYEADIKASPQKNKANIELIKLFAKYFNTPASKIEILSGDKNRIKTLEIKED